MYVCACVYVYLCVYKQMHTKCNCNARWRKPNAKKSARTTETTWRRLPPACLAASVRIKASAVALSPFPSTSLTHSLYTSVLAEFHVGGRPNTLMNVCNYNSQTRSNFAEYTLSRIYTLYTHLPASYTLQCCQPSPKRHNPPDSSLPATSVYMYIVYTYTAWRTLHGDPFPGLLDIIPKVPESKLRKLHHP